MPVSAPWTAVVLALHRVPSADTAPALPTARIPLVEWVPGSRASTWRSATCQPSTPDVPDVHSQPDRSTFVSSGTDNERYHILSVSRQAPAAGTVGDVFPDIPPRSAPLSAVEETGQPVHPAGNHVVIQTADSEFVFLGHVQKHSISVRPGDTMLSGDHGGRVGNSGNTSEPHIHIHAQSSADLFDPMAFGVPIRFGGYLANGDLVDLAGPQRGEFVEHVR